MYKSTCIYISSTSDTTKVEFAYDGTFRKVVINQKQDSQAVCNAELLKTDIVLCRQILFQH